MASELFWAAIEEIVRRALEDKLSSPDFRRIVIYDSELILLEEAMLEREAHG